MPRCAPKYLATHPFNLGFDHLPALDQRVCAPCHRPPAEMALVEGPQ